MAAKIESITVGGVKDSRLVLYNHQAARLISIGNSWSQIKIGMRYTLGDPGAALTGGPGIILGLLSNPSALVANGPLSGSATGHYWGVFGSGTVSWSRSSDHLGGVIACGSKIGATFTNFAGPNLEHSTDPNIRKILMFQFDKAGTITRCKITGVGSWSTIDHTKEMLMHLFDLIPVGDSSITNQQYNNVTGEGITTATTGANGGALTIDEGTNGPLNAIVVGWDRAVVPIYISDLMWGHYP